jgi:hypothetical protein
MLVVALDRETGINPILLTLKVVTHICVSQREMTTSVTIKIITASVTTESFDSFLDDDWHHD